MRGLSFHVKKPFVEGTIIAQAKRNKEIVYGGRSIKRQTGLSFRKTEDFDLFSKTPKNSANELKKKLDAMTSIKNDFYTKKGRNVTTWKVKHVGVDGKKGTDDDVGIADYTKMPKPTPPTVNIDGVLYRKLKAELKAKENIVNNPEFVYRKDKDQADLTVIRRILNKLGGKVNG